jgi:peptide/nickel transport system substrate-binding protein
MNLQRPLVAAVTTVALVALTAGCSSSKKGGRGATPSGSDSGVGGNIVNPGYTTKGGTVYILNDANFNHIDPVQNYITNQEEFGRLVFRTLTFIDDAPGKKPQNQAGPCL